MKLVKLTPTVTLLANAAPGVPVNVIQHEGVYYLPMFSMDLGAPVEDEDFDDAPATRKPAGKLAVSKSPAKPSVSRPSLKAMQGMLLPDLVELAKKAGVNLEELKAERKVARWSVVTLAKALDEIFDVPDNDDGEEESPAPRKGGKKTAANNDDKEQFLTILADLDSTEITEDEAAQKLQQLCGNKKVAKEIINVFQDDASITTEDLWEKYAEHFDGTESAPVSKPAGKSPKGAAKPVAVDPEDLEEGDSVRAYWDAEEQWFKGTVTGFDDDEQPIISYEDGTEAAYDPEQISQIEKY